MSKITVNDKETCGKPRLTRLGGECRLVVNDVLHPCHNVIDIGRGG